MSETSLVIAKSSRQGVPLSARETIARVRHAVVRIETDIGSGSGFIIAPNGLILTNNHVVRDARVITIFLEDGTRYFGTIQGRDMVRDLAIVSINAGDLPSLKLGDLGQVDLGTET